MSSQAQQFISTPPFLLNILISMVQESSSLTPSPYPSQRPDFNALSKTQPLTFQPTRHRVLNPASHLQHILPHQDSLGLDLAP